MASKGSVTRLADGDPRPARRQARYEEILAAAWDIAAEQGLSGVSLHEVARTVGLRQPSLYAYIESKSALYDAMFAQVRAGCWSTQDRGATPTMPGSRCGTRAWPCWTS
jgi:AcrR family transcriptional regulator